MKRREHYLKLAAAGKLPQLEPDESKLINLCLQESPPLGQVIALVESNAMLSEMVLKYAQSALIDTGPYITNLANAIEKIGFSGLSYITFTFSLLFNSKFERCKNFSLQNFWSYSLARATAGQALVMEQNLYDPYEIFTCLLFNRIGVLGFINTHPVEYGTLLSQDLPQRQLLLAEQDLFGINHHEVTAELYRDWRLPEVYIDTILLQGSSDQEKTASPEIAKMRELFHLADQLAAICTLDLPLSIDFDDVEKLAAKRGVQPENFDSFFDHLVQTWHEWGHLCRITIQQSPIYHQVKKLEESSIEKLVHRGADEPIRILAVDDDPLIVMNLSLILKHQSREIITATNGEEALKLAREHKPEMVITDWMMPKLDGLQLCKALRAGSTTLHTYIIMLTGMEAEDELVKAFNAGADDYVVKPFKPKVLKARIRSGERLIRYQRTINIDREVIQMYAIQLTAANRKLHTAAMTDPLTGLPNRRSAMDHLKHVVSESQRHNEKLSCVMIDIDHFKKVNDTYGHDNGDIVLREIASIFSNNARSYDMVSRIGGEEFLIICNRSDGLKTHSLAERLRTTVEEHDIRLSDGATTRVTISAGVATWTSDFQNQDQFIKAADRALYEAKQNGRNQVKLAWK